MRTWLKPKELKTFLSQHWPIILVVLLITTSFTYGWFFDTSKPRGGLGWADQTVYTEAAQRLATGSLPTASQLHYAVGYPLLGVFGYLFSPTDPFMTVSFGLLLASALLCFFAARNLVGKWWALLFVGLLFAWEGVARVFQFSSDLFAIPWNNQVLFFALAFFFWLFSSKQPRQPSYKLTVLVALVSGLTFLSREEAILFVGPLAGLFLVLSKAAWQKWLLCFALIAACFLPQVVIKQQVLGSVARSGRSNNYSQLSGNYLQPAFLQRNLKETIFNSTSPRNLPGRPALLQAAPWLTLGFIGAVFILFSKRYPWGLRGFVLVSGWLLIFYLAGVNMSAHKLKFHCLRYIAPSFIVLNFGAVVFVKESIGFTKKRMKQAKATRI